MPARGSQNPPARVPSSFGQECRIDQPGQPGRLLIGQAPAAEHVADRAWRHYRRRPGHRRGHEVTPASSRGLGTASTAARSRAGSGWA